MKTDFWKIIIIYSLLIIFIIILSFIIAKDKSVQPSHYEQETVIGYVVTEQNVVATVQYDIRWSMCGWAVSLKDSLITFRGKPIKVVARLMCISYYPEPLLKEEFSHGMSALYRDGDNYYRLACEDSTSAHDSRLKHIYENEFVVLKDDLPQMQ